MEGSGMGTMRTSRQLYRVARKYRFNVTVDEA
jgi:hypothetical protein